MSKRPTKDPHFGEVDNPKIFQEAYKSVSYDVQRQYTTRAGTIFTCEAKITSRGTHKGEKVIIFKQSNVEMARSYKCCWDKQTNCNRTYIDLYTREI